MKRPEAIRDPSAPHKPKPPQAASPAAPADTAPARAGLAALIGNWAEEEGPWWLCSFVFHLVLVCSLALVGTKAVVAIVSEVPVIETPPPEPATPVTLDPPQKQKEDDFLTTSDLRDLTKRDGAGDGSGDKIDYIDENPVYVPRTDKTAIFSDRLEPGRWTFDIHADGTGPRVRYQTGTRDGDGPPRSPYINRDPSGQTGGPRPTRPEKLAIARALDWLARHQLPDGSWSLSGYTVRCKSGARCSGQSAAPQDIAGTALGLLPLLAAGQTHETKGPYKQVIAKGVYYLVSRQKSDGGFGDVTMYEHGLAAIALSECFGMTGDPKVRVAAQRALDFIVAAQDPNGGGWRYHAREPGDVSVTGWQVMALKSGQMASLSVDPAVLERAKRFLDSLCSSGAEGTGNGGRFGYTLAGDFTPTRSAVGLLCYQYLGVQQSDPVMVNGTAYLMENLPRPSGDDEVYYWYYATQVMYNQLGPNWDTWNRAVRKRLVDSQCREGCGAGSWDPKSDEWGRRGGRVMQTALSTLTLEVYYRYLPLYQLNKDRALAAGKAP
jgi:hypothetical protein